MSIDFAQKNLKPDIIAASEPLVQKANDELEKIRKVFSKLEEKIKQSQASILEDHVAQESQHAEAALDKLEDFAETSKENAVRAAAAQENARHQIEKGFLFTNQICRIFCQPRYVALVSFSSSARRPQWYVREVFREPARKEARNRAGSRIHVENVRIRRLYYQ